MNLPNLPTDNYNKFFTLVALVGCAYYFYQSLQVMEVYKKDINEYDSIISLMTQRSTSVRKISFLSDLLAAKNSEDSLKAYTDLKAELAKDSIHYSISFGMMYIETKYIDTSKALLKQRLIKELQNFDSINERLLTNHPKVRVELKPQHPIKPFNIPVWIPAIMFAFYSFGWWKSQARQDYFFSLQIRELENKLGIKDTEEMAAISFGPQWTKIWSWFKRNKVSVDKKV